tara:strand:- start:1100 stop:1648 length:549 start_codon:yes stop_codon:yes gene_type:complete
MSNSSYLNDTDDCKDERTPQSYSHVIVDGSEHVLVHRINDKTWAAINGQNKLVPVTNFRVLENTAERNGQKMCCPVFCVASVEGLQPVMLHDMMRQIFAYGWTSGIALQGEDVWEWDILAQTWLVNGTALDMAIITPRGDVLLDRPISPVVTHKKNRWVKRCVYGHWNPCQARECRHCKKEF